MFQPDCLQEEWEILGFTGVMAEQSAPNPSPALFTLSLAAMNKILVALSEEEGKLLAATTVRIQLF